MGIIRAAVGNTTATSYGLNSAHIELCWEPLEGPAGDCVWFGLALREAWKVHFAQSLADAALIASAHGGDV